MAAPAPGGIIDLRGLLAGGVPPPDPADDAAAGLGEDAGGALDGPPLEALVQLMKELQIMVFHYVLMETTANPTQLFEL